MLIYNIMQIGTMLNKKQNSNPFGELPVAEKTTFWKLSFGNPKNSKHRVVHCGDDEDLMSNGLCSPDEDAQGANDDEPEELLSKSICEIVDESARMQQDGSIASNQTRRPS